MFRINLRQLALRPLLLAFCVVLLDCATLDKLPDMACGNGVVDVGTEDCDTFPNDPNDKTHARCGAPSEGEFACHLRCGTQPSGATLTCPDGWGCSVAGICREPTGNFKNPLGAVSGGANQLAVGDFDGDGRRDLIGFGLRNTTTNASRLRVHFFDDRGLLTNVAALPGQSVSPAVFDHDHDGRDDIAFGVAIPGSNGVLGVVHGLADKTFLPVVFASATLPDTNAVAGFVYPRPDTDLPSSLPLKNQPYAVLALEHTEPTQANQLPIALISLAADLSGTEKLALPLSLGAEAVRGPLASGMMFPENPGSTCGELVVAMQPAGASTSVLYVLSPCTVRASGKTSRWNSDPATALKTFPVGAALADTSHGALIADVDGDGHLDVLIDTVDGPYVAYGDGMGSLVTPRRWVPLGVSASPGSAPMPLAAGDLDLDGKTDFVFPSFVALRNAGAAGDTAGEGGTDGGADGGSDAGMTGNRDGRLYPMTPLQAWTDAVIGNVNADPYPDIILARKGAPDLVAVLGGDNRVDGPTFTTITTNGRVDKIAIGDFDGDHIDDLAITESTSTTGTSDLSIAYGRPFGALEPPARIGSVDTPQGLAAAVNGSSPADLGLYAHSNDKSMYGTTSLTLLKGSGDRQPIAPLLFIEPLSCSRKTVDMCNPARPEQTTTRFWNPVGVAAGHFAQPDNSAVLSYAIGTPGGKPLSIPIGAWVADVAPVPGGLSAPVEREILDNIVQVVDSGGTIRLATATGSIDANDKAHLEKIVAISNLPDPSKSALVVVDPATKPPTIRALQLPGLRVEVGAQLSLVDVDGDGYLDAVGLFSEASVTQVYVFLNKSGAFTDPGIKVTFSVDDPATAGIGNVVAFAPINLHGAPATGGAAQTKGLAVLTEHSVMLVNLRSDKKSFDSTSLGSLLGKDFGATTGIAAGDFNGDGVDDIAIAVNGSIRILLQTPARAPK